MPKIAFVFPGQGSQQVGMGRDFAEASPTARQLFETFDRVVTPPDDVSGEPAAPLLSTLCFDGPEELLKQTLYTQPAILVTSLAALALFKEHCPTIDPVAVAGHSLGEYAAVYAAGFVDLVTVATLVQKRAELMAHAPAGAMSAVLGLKAAEVGKIVRQLNAQGVGPICLANDNTPEQVVISGAAEAVEAAAPLLKEAGAKRVIPLVVGGAFHSPLMADAEAQFRDFLRLFSFRPGSIPVVTNVDAQLTDHPSDISRKLSQQIKSSVQWTQTMALLVNELGVDTVIEFGPGKVLTGMFRKTHPQVTTYNVFDRVSLAETCQALLNPVAV